ncbi:MAG: hypothetical protein RL885_10890 [Planctomycetota bacterium]
MFNALWLLWIPLWLSPLQEPMPEGDQAALDQEIREVQERGRRDGKHEAAVRDTVGHLVELERRFREKDVSPERLAYLLYDAASRLESRIGDREGALDLYREGHARYPETRWGGRECLKKARELTVGVGAKLPELTGLHGGQPFRLDPSDSEWTVIVFLEAEQPLCRRRLSELLASDRLPKKARVFAALLGDPGEPWPRWCEGQRRAVETVEQASGTEWPVAFAFDSIPQLFLIDAEGVVRAEGKRPRALLDAIDDKGR